MSTITIFITINSTLNCNNFNLPMRIMKNNINNHKNHYNNGDAIPSTAII
jgi:hypothetical protein